MRKWFVPIKEVWRNGRFLSKWKKKQPSGRSAMGSGELEKAYESLKSVAKDDDELLKHLDKLKSTADEGQRMSWWTRRFVFGFGISKAIENWFKEFDKADQKLPLLARIPRKETSSIAAKWVWFGFLTTVLSVCISTLVSAITAYYLQKQTKVLSRQVSAAESSNALLKQQLDNTRLTDTSARRTQYAEILFDRRCDEKERCLPVYNFRIRSEAARAFLLLEWDRIDVEKNNEGQFTSLKPDFMRAELRDTDLPEINFSNVNLFEADLQNATLLNANFTNSNLTNTIFVEAGLEDAIFVGAHLVGAKFLRANLIGADFSDATLKGADLSEALLATAKITQEQLDDACGTNTQLFEGLSIEPCK